MTTDAIRLEDGCTAMTVCFNLKPNYTAFLFPNGARRHRFYWMDDRDSLHDLKREIAYMIDPHTQDILSSLSNEPQPTETTTTAISSMNDLFNHVKDSYIPFFILFYMIFLFLCVATILFLQIRYIRRYRQSYNPNPRLTHYEIQENL
jgi:hypothetical protein